MPDPIAARTRHRSLPYFLLGAGAFLGLYIPQPLLPELDRAFGTQPAVTGLVITATLLGFALAGLLGEGDPRRTLRRAMWLTAICCLVAAAGPNLWVVLAARFGQGLGIGLLIAGGLADVPRRLPPAVAGRVTGALISGTAFGGLLGRAFAYFAIILTWRGAMALGGLGLLALVGYGLHRLPRIEAGAAPQPRPAGSVPMSLVLAGGGILFVSVGLFDLIPYRLQGDPFHLPAAAADLVYLVFIAATVAGLITGRAVDRFGTGRVILAVSVMGVATLLLGLFASIPALVIAAAGGISGTVGLHVAHSGAAARYGRAAVGYYLAAYYLGGALAAPLMAAVYQRFGWAALILSLCGAWVVVAVLAAARKDPDRPEGQRPKADLAPAGTLG